MTTIDISDRRIRSAKVIRNFFVGRSFAGRPYLISPFFDFLTAGGAGLIVLGVFLVFYPRSEVSSPGNQSVLQISLIFSALAYFVNFPHFMASYELLYNNLQRRLSPFSTRDLMWWRYINAAYIVPVVLVVFFLYLLVQRDYATLGMCVHLMFFFVGWHYVKQSYGVFIVLSGMKGIYYATWQTVLLKLHSYTLWIYTWYKSGMVISNAGQPGSEHYLGLNYKPLPMYKTAEAEQLVFSLVILCGILAYVAILARWYTTRKRPSFTALIGYTSMYPLFAFSRLHPLFAYAAPMFHSLQYMLFVYAYKRGEWQMEGLHEYAPTPEESRVRSNWLKALKYFLFIAATGAIGFDVLPTYFEGKGPNWGLTIPGMFLFHLFINTHHYFIDSVIWRKDNRDVSRNLFAKR